MEWQVSWPLEPVRLNDGMADNILNDLDFSIVRLDSSLSRDRMLASLYQ